MIETHPAQCKCPFCPLMNANVQVCDVLIKIVTEDAKRMNWGIRCDEELKCFKNEFYTLALYARNNCKLKVGNSIDLSRPGLSCNVNHLEKNIYKICFHTLNDMLTDPQEPVIVMD